MNFHGKDIKIFAASANQRMAKQISECLGLSMGKSEGRHVQRRGNLGFAL